ncbi:hypothetical protein [Paeniglutamicibacter kerguelensis]|uniref:PatG C-terminal domain-containing protein n=1 Tax=Paeniglutamicibacter kerguelensis TaxID=254788 RepID=A0ABS4X854_9MICC|nr:hypothetical protein [Paeniglutamicibacter kerguelensis]MBP2384644.1 hypothetical protein [Paeniglutamicibacter kerguelensis]
MDPMMGARQADEEGGSADLQPGEYTAHTQVTQQAFVYAIGQVQPRFPSLGVEKEFAQVAGQRATATSATDRQIFRETLSDPGNRYLARQLCWVFMIGGLESYLLMPRDRADFDLLVEAVRSSPEPTDLDVVVGKAGPLSQPEACGLIVPIVAFDQLYSFDRSSLLGAIPKPENATGKKLSLFRATSAELFDRIMQLADNAGNTDEHRALNYLAVRYPDIYTQTAIAHEENASLDAVDVRLSRLSGVRKVLDVIFSYRNRRTDVVHKYFVRVDVTEEFPFLVTKLSPFYDR